MQLISVFDIIWSVVLILIIMSVAKNKQSKNISTLPYYKFYTKGLLIKITGGVLFCLIYALFYKGGDTVNYYKGVEAMMSVFTNNPLKYIQILFLDGEDPITGTAFWNVRHFPPSYMLEDSRTFLVIKLSSLFALPALGGFLSTTILLSTFIYGWVWKLYGFVVQRYPEHLNQVNWAILYLPSTFFWGSGIMKDTFAFGATCYAVYGLHQIVIEKKFNLKNLLFLSFSIFLIIEIKSYILLALLPGLLLFANFERIRKIKSTLVKIIVLPIVTVLIFVLLNALFSQGGEAFGKYSADNVLEEAAVQNQDLQRAVYGSNSFDIGAFEPTPAGVLSKFFPAVNAALFRPYIWETGSPTMLFSGIENTVIMLLSFWVFLFKPLKLLKLIGSDPFFLFSFLFTLMLAFGVGLSTANFGALVRYKIPFMPFYLLLILVAYKSTKKKKKKGN